MNTQTSVPLGFACLVPAAGAAQAESKPKKFINAPTVRVQPEGADGARSLDESRSACLEGSQGFIVQYRADLSRLG